MSLHYFSIRSSSSGISHTSVSNDSEPQNRLKCIPVDNYMTRETNQLFCVCYYSDYNFMVDSNNNFHWSL